MMHAISSNNRKEDFRWRKTPAGTTATAKNIVSSANTFRNFLKKTLIAGKACILLIYISKITATTRATNGYAGKKYLFRIFGSSQYNGKLAANAMRENIKISLLNAFFTSCRRSLLVISGIRNNEHGIKDSISSNG